MELVRDIIDILWTAVVSVTIAHYWARRRNAVVAANSASHNSARVEMPPTCRECRWYLQCALFYGDDLCRKRLAAHSPVA